MSAPICVLTGATGGIGQAIARLLAKQGWRLLLVGRDHAQLRQLQGQCENDAEIFVGDLNLLETRTQLADFAKRLGGAAL